MLKYFYIPLIILTLCLNDSLGATQSPPPAPAGWKLIWHDEFNVDGPPNPDYWTHEEGFVRNEELQWYQSDNATCSQGKLIIEGRKERVVNTQYKQGGKSWKEKRKEAQYTASCVKTREKFEFLYGRLEVKAKIPCSSGAWPAIWTLGRSHQWPSGGEIYLLELYLVKDVPTILANVAWGNNKPHQAVWDSSHTPLSHFLEKDKDWADKFHIWRMDWDEESIKLYLDDELLNTTPLSRTKNGSIGKYSNPFTMPQYILLNLAMGANGGKIDESKLPMRYEIDYVRVYQKEGK